MSEENKDYFGLNSDGILKPAPGSKLNFEESEADEKETDTKDEGKKPEKVKAKLTFSIKQVILIIIIAVVAACAVTLTVVSKVNNVNPFSYISGEIHKDQLVNKWQSQNASGLSAYEFFDDGTYKSYIFNFPLSGNYSVRGDILTLTNPNTAQNVVYKYSIHGDKLSLTLIEENGTPMSGIDTDVFDKVDMFNQKTFSDLLDEIQEKNEAEAETQAETEATTAN